MIWKAIALLALAVCALSEDNHRYAYSEQMVEFRNVKRGHHGELGHIGQKPEHHHEYAYAYPSYEFSYKVSDPHTHDFKGQHESRDGDVVKGVYWLVQPDGVKRTVKYHADKHSGFNAEVHYDGPHKHRVEYYKHHEVAENPEVENRDAEGENENRDAEGENENRESEDRENENNERENRERENQERENRESENRERENRERENRERENRERENSGRENRGRENRGRENRGRENRERENRERENRERENRERESREQENRERENRERENRQRENSNRMNRERENEDREPEAARRMPKEQHKHKMMKNKPIVDHIVPVFGERESESEEENREPMVQPKPIPVFDFERIQPKVEYKEHQVENKEEKNKKHHGYHREIYHPYWIHKEKQVEQGMRMQEENRNEEAEPERRLEEVDAEGRDGSLNRNEAYYGHKRRYYKH